MRRLLVYILKTQIHTEQQEARNTTTLKDCLGGRSVSINLEIKQRKIHRLCHFQHCSGMLDMFTQATPEHLF